MPRVSRSAQQASGRDGSSDLRAGTAVPPLRAEGLHFAWRGRAVLRGVSLTLGCGDIVLLRGSNGVGKTTLLRLLAGALEPDGGVVDRGSGAGVASESSTRTVLGLVGASDRGLYARLDVRANVELEVALGQAPRARRRQLVSAALTRFELDPLARRRVDRLSTGQRQRVRLALGFASDPGVVLLDEPGASLDAAGADLLRAALEELGARGAAALWTAPLGAPVSLHATRVCTLDGGLVRSG